MKTGRGLLLILTVIALLSGLASADEHNFSAQEGFDWLYEQMDSSGSFSSDVGTTALAMLALNSQKYPITDSLEWIQGQKSSDNCYPSDGCDVEDTSWALISLKKLNEDYSGIEDWLIDAQSSSPLTGDFLLEITTDANGTCTFSYERNEQIIEKPVWVSHGYFPDFGNTTFLNLDEDLEANLITNYPSLDIDIDCKSLTGDITITYLYKSSDIYYLFASDSATSTSIKVNNGCFGRTKDGSCSNEVSLYANWALHMIESPVDTKMYLLENYEEGNVVQDALLYLITEDTTYLDDLAEQQKTDGSFERDAYKTALAVLALDKDGGYSTNVDNAKEYLKGKQKDDGSWDSDIETSAMVLYAAFYNEAVIPISAPYEAGEEEACNFDSICDEDDGETYSNCPTDCEKPSATTAPSGEEPECETDDDCYVGYECIKGECVKEEEEEVCNENDICETGETSSNCPDDCGCDYDEECEPERNENESNCPSDCEEGGAGVWIVIIIIILVAAGAIGYFIYKKKQEGGKAQPRSPYSFGSFRAPAKPSAGRPAPGPARRTFASKTESELGKSLEEARRLLGK